MAATMIASILFCVFVMSVAGSLEEECNILIKLDSLEARVQEQEVSLREQAVSLAEKDSRIADLEQSMTEKDTRIGDLEQSMTEKDTRIGDLEQSMIEKDTRIGDLEQSMTESLSSSTENNAHIGELEASLSQQATAISELRTALNTTLNINATVLANLEQRLRPVQAVGFSAKDPKESQTSPTQMAFKTVLTNEGGALNADTGVFTCPLAGLYYFSAALLKATNHNDAAFCHINKNGDLLVYAYMVPGHDPLRGRYPVVNGVYTRLAVNDTVKLGGCYPNIADAFDGYSSYSGFLVTADD